MFEYTKEHNIELVSRKMYIIEIAEYLENINKNEKCLVYLENCPSYKILHIELNKRGIDNQICYDAENWQRHRWRERLPQMEYVAYWQYIKPPTIDDIEISNGEISIWNGLRCEASFLINYCPHCGRKLGEENV